MKKAVNFVASFLGLVLVASFGLVACAADTDGADSRSDMVFSKPDNIELNAAMGHARDTFSEFLNAKAKNNPNYSDFNVKVGLSNSEGTIEHIWVSNVVEDNEQFRATLINEPFRLPNYKNGDTVLFAASQVSDWQYLINGKSEGNFTTRVLLKKMPKDKAEKIRVMLGWVE